MAISSPSSALDKSDTVPDTVLAKAPYRIGTVSLIARDLTALTRFYRNAIGLAVIARETDTVRLGVDGRVLLVLRHDPAAQPWSPRDAGLFHTAFLLPSRADLGAWLVHAEQQGISLSGAADHLVSEAVYLSDLEGNGIEICVDRPSSAWPWAGDGTVVMRNDPLDRPGLMRAGVHPWAGMPAGTRVGHVHLQVGDLETAERFYADLLGFDVTCRYPGALFLGAGGYHHQLAGNIWNSRNATMRTEGTAGLAEVELYVEGTSLTVACTRCQEAGLPIASDGDAFVPQDPWGTRLCLTPAPSR